MGLSSPGIGSNLDINSIVSQLMATESRPLTMLQKQEAKLQSTLSAFGQVQSALATFQGAVTSLSDVKQFQAVKATPSDAAVMTASATASATPGTYSIEVSKLAQAQKLATAGQASTTAAIGSGTLTFEFGTSIASSTDANGIVLPGKFVPNGNGGKTITIDPTSNSLAGIRDAINKADIGVSATIVNDGGTAPNRLVLTSSSTGEASSMKISVSGDSNLQALLTHDPANASTDRMTQTVKAQNAEFAVDGLAVSKASNHITDLIEGVTLDLTKTNAGSPAKLAIAQDTGAVVASVTKFVTAFNAINKTLTDATGYNATTKTAGLLNGDSTIRGMQSQLRGVLASAVAGGYGKFDKLSDIGVAMQKDGTLALDTAKLNKVLGTNFNDVAGLFAAAGRTTDSLTGYAGASAKTQAGSYAVKVTALATHGSAAAATGFATPLDFSAAGSNTFDVSVDGVSSSITLNPVKYSSAKDLALELQSKINGSSAFAATPVTVSADANGALSILSSSYGPSSKVTFSGVNADRLLGTARKETVGLDVAGTIDGAAATGKGISLTASDSGAASGIRVDVTGGAIGDRGTVNYSKGYASQFNDLISTFLGTGGRLTARTEGINKSIASVKKDEDRWTDRLTTREADLRKQFTALDTKLSSLTSTSTYLTQQLAQIAAMSRSS
ncbi:flagellar filament capping protein FliD [Noviherbaspirillum soli]|uniref:flagellar filament capping protein FliD n=1 Tax=Noviherbaspirillum soli TaxID=1064518 RepID=UPI00188A89EC|nr:flagellar filament capping protein FliD [Noviherbaspirillum soli]